MIAKIETTLPCTPEQLWQRITQPESLRFVAAPLITFQPLAGEDLASSWQEGSTSVFRLHFLGIVPLGRHSITIATLDEAQHRIISNESGSLTKVWNHEIHFHSLDEGKSYYVDEVEIQAGLLTLPVWLFANVFYRHRQRRWKVLLNKSS